VRLWGVVSKDHRGLEHGEATLPELRGSSHFDDPDWISALEYDGFRSLQLLIIGMLGCSNLAASVRLIPLRFGKCRDRDDPPYSSGSLWIG
jgi:hypothetical protein